MNTKEESTSEATARMIRPGGSSPVTGKSFLGRDADLEILVYRARKAIHTLLVGPRRMGKTSLLLELQLRYQDEFIGLFLDLEGDRSPQDVIRRLADTMRPYLAFFDRNLALMEKYWNKIVPMASLPKLLQFHETVNAGNWSSKGDSLFDLLAKLEKPVILCLDEIPIFINRLINNDQKRIAEDFMHWLRGAIQRHSHRVSVVLCGSIGFLPILERVNLSDTINIITVYRLEPWKKETAVDFLRGVARHDDLTYEDGAEDFIVDILRCCIPHHLQLLYQELVEQCRREGRRVISREMAGQACEKLINSGKGDSEFQHYVGRLRSAYSEIVFKAACDILTETAREEPQKWECLKKICLKQKLSEEETRMLLKCLTTDGYLEETETGMRFISLLFQRWWKREYVKETT